MTARLALALKAARHLRGPRVLSRDTEGEMTRGVLRIWMEKAQRRAGLPETGCLHVMRHSFCSRLAMAGARAKAIQELAGHANLSTTLRYMHLSPTAKAGAIGMLVAAGQVRGEMLEKVAHKGP